MYYAFTIAIIDSIPNWAKRHRRRKRGGGGGGGVGKGGDSSPPSFKLGGHRPPPPPTLPTIYIMNSLQYCSTVVFLICVHQQEKGLYFLPILPNIFANKRRNAYYSHLFCSKFFRGQTVLTKLPLIGIGRCCDLGGQHFFKPQKCDCKF